MFFYSHFSVKFKAFSVVAAAFICCFAFSACQRVSEEAVNTGYQTANSVILTEETTQTAGLTNEAQTGQDETKSVVESETTLQHDASSTTVTDVPDETQTESSITEKPKKTLNNQENITSK